MAYTYSIDDPSKNSKRMAAFVLVVIIHVLFVYVLASGLGKKVVEVVLGPVETRLIEELPDEEEEPPPPPEIETPPPYVPPPEISIDIPVDSGPTTAISNVTSERPVAAPAPRPPVRPSTPSPRGAAMAMAADGGGQVKFVLIGVGIAFVLALLLVLAGRALIGG